VAEEKELPEDVRAFLRLRIETYEALELLQLFQREPEKRWSATELGERLHVSPELAHSTAQALEAVGLAAGSTTELTTRYGYYQADPATNVIVERVLQLYRDQPVQVMKFMSGNAIERVRTAALRAFSDAFVLKKDPDRG
jgi:hypothetical protein